jgi:hypothetical protein
MAAVRASEKSANFNVTTRQYIPEHSKVQTRRRENLKSHMLRTAKSSTNCASKQRGRRTDSWTSPGFTAWHGDVASFVAFFLVKVKLSCYRHAGGKRERKYYSYSFLTSALDRGEWSASRPGRTLLSEKDPRYPLDRRLGGLQIWSGHRSYRKRPLPLPGIEPRPSILFF